MPLSQAARYRVHTTPKGEKIRLAFAKGTNRVIEAKSLSSGKVHTEAEFKADRRKTAKGQKLKAALMKG